MARYPRVRSIVAAVARRSRPLLAGVLTLALLPGGATAAEATDLDMAARILLGGHTRVGSWMAIEVHFENRGPAVVGELRLTGGSQARTRYNLVVDLPTQSAKTYTLYAEPPSFRQKMTVSLVSGETVIAERDVVPTLHEQFQLVIGIVAETPDRIGSSVRLGPDVQGGAPAIANLGLADLPDRAAAWSGLDRLIWQDLDAGELSPDQLAALETWIAQGGRLVIVGGTSGAATLTAFPDRLLPFRPSTTIEVPPPALSSLIGEVPADVTPVAALAGELVAGTPLATSGDRTIAAQLAYGAGSVTIVGFDPSVGWIRDAGGAENLWPRVIPQRNGGPILAGDDSRLVEATSRLPSLALPPVGGLVWLLAGYILLIGPINYLVLRRLDRRELAWITMPALIAVFSVGAYGFGAAVRGADVIVNQIAIVRGGPNATVGTGIVYLGVFSPTRGNYDVEVSTGALLSSAIAADFFGGDSGSLDIVQGEPARVRQLAVGFGSLRTIRAEAPAEVPRIQADLVLRDGRVEGTVTNASDVRLERAAVVVGSTAKHIGNLEPGATVDVSFVVAGQGNFGATISEQILGNSFFDGSIGESTAFQRTEIRRAVLDQLTYDPWTGWSNALPSDGAVLLAFADRPVLDVTIAGQEPQRTGETLYYLPVDLPAEGRLVVSSGLFRTSVIESSALFFSPDPFGTGLGQGSATVAYQPLTFGTSVMAEKLFVSITPGGGADINPGRALPAEILLEPPNYCPNQGLGPVDDPVEPCVQPPLDGTPDVELFDRTGEGSWTSFAHFTFGSTYEIPNPDRFVDPGSGTILVRYVNPGPNETYFGFGIRLEGTVR